MSNELGGTPGGLRTSFGHMQQQQRPSFTVSQPLPRTSFTGQQQQQQQQPQQRTSFGHSMSFSHSQPVQRTSIGQIGRSFSLSSHSRLSDAQQQQQQHSQSFYSGRLSATHEPMDVDPVEVISDDVVLAPRLSLSGGHDNHHVNMHAIL